MFPEDSGREMVKGVGPGSAVGSGREMAKVVDPCGAVGSERGQGSVCWTPIVTG
jgi:hypothetical protein